MANQHTGGKWNVYDEQIKQILEDNKGIEPINIVKIITKGLTALERQAFSQYIRRNVNRINNIQVVLKGDENEVDEDLENETTTETTQYRKNRGFTAISSSGGIMDINQYCEFYGFDYDTVKSWKLVSHTGIPYYNIAFYSSEEQFENDYLEIKEILTTELEKCIKHTSTSVAGNEVANIIIGDPHLGAYINGLVNTKDFSIPILIDYIEDIVVKVNKRGFSEVNVMFLGDMIESFTGLNHKNSWKGLQKGMIGAEVIKFSVKIWHEKFLSKINNLKKVKLVAGNHDRLTSDKEEDVDGGAADLIAFGLELLGYDIEFHPTVISCEIDGINYILLHGHKGISKKATKDICWDFGKKGVFNVILEGHLHSIIQKLSMNMKGKFNIIKDDSVDHIRMHARSLFTGNGYSEDLGFTSNAGFSIITNNGKGLPDIDNKLL